MEQTALMGFWIYPIAFLIVLTVVVFFHELGHFQVARWCGVKVESFSIGFGKEILGWTDKQGTRWKISLLPLGGYVKFAGDLGPASTPDREKLEEFAAEARAQGHEPDDLLHFKPVWQRAAVTIAGPVANFILAIVVFTGLYMSNEMITVDPVVGTVKEGSVAEAAGLQPGDRIVEINGRAIEKFDDIVLIITLSADTEARIKVLRDGDTVELTATPARVETEDRFGNKQKVGQLGISSRSAEEDIHRTRHTPAQAVGKAVGHCWMIVDRTFVYIGRIFIGKEDAKQLGGPIRIAKYSGQMAQLGPLAIINMIAVLSVSIGLINLFPIPLMDGGHLVYYGFEAVRGQPLSERAQEAGFRIGLFIVLLLMVYVTWNDLVDIDAFGKLSGILS